MVEVLPLLALIVPFVLWPVEILLPYPFLIEELVKVLFAYQLKASNLKLCAQVKLMVLICGLLGFSESILYLFNIYINGNLSNFFLRLLFTLPMHMLTGVVIIYGVNKSKFALIIGFIIAICIHYLFNELVVF